MEPTWELLTIDRNIQHLGLLRDFLEINGITVQLVNKSDSSFPSTGESELYVLAEQLDAAEALMNDFNAGENEPLP